MQDQYAKIITGAHVPVKGELKNSISYAKNIGADAIQIFGSSPLRWDVKDRSEKEVLEFKSEIESGEITQVFLHAPYLVNLAGANRNVLNKSIRALKKHMNIAERVGAVGLIVHPGSSGQKDQRDKKEIINQISGVIKTILKDMPGNTFFIMENTAGAGATFGKDSDELGAVMKNVNSSRLKICIDTAHAYGSGILKFESTGEVSGFFKDWENDLGEERIVVMHVNDSKVEFGSNKDRHENIGEGFIGMDGFRYLAQSEHARKIPWILEVPGFANKGPDKENIMRLKNIFKDE